MFVIQLLLIFSGCSTYPSDSAETETEAAPVTNNAGGGSGMDADGSDTADPADGETEGTDGVADDDTSVMGDGEDTDADGSTGPDLPEFSMRGSRTVATSTGSFAAADGCTLSYTRFAPISGDSLGDAFILHGFMRSQDQFSELATHLASWGITSTTVDLCHSVIGDVDAEQNAQDVIDLAADLGAERVVWMGQSNGGVSALIAGGMAPALTAGVLGLDPVESIAGTGADWSDNVESPAAALFGISDSCNDSNSGFAVYSGTDDSTSLRVTESDHCSFEFPTGLLCTALCERPKTMFTNVEISKTILELSTAWSIARLDSTFDPSPWWAAGGQRYTTLIERGAISPM